MENNKSMNNKFGNAAPGYAELLYFLFTSEESNTEEIEIVLENAGINKEQLLRDGRQLVDRLYREQKALAAQRKQNVVANILNQMRQVDFNQPIKSIKEKFNEVLTTVLGESAAVAFFHKFENATEQDIRQMLNQTELLTKIEELLESSTNENDK